MKTTSFNAENMQGATGTDAFVSLPPTASTSFSATLAPVESSISGNKTGDRVPASLWIRRLKPRDEPETVKRETFASGTEARHGFHFEKSDPGSSSAYPFGGQATSSSKAWVNKALAKDKTLVDEGKAVLKLKWDSLNEIRQQLSSSEPQDYGGGRQQNKCKQGRGVTPSPIPSNSGFCQQINQVAGAKLERKPATKSNVNSRYTSEPAMIRQTCSQPRESKNQVSHAVKVQAEESIRASSLGKPPLPPAHTKFGCSPKPTDQKSLGFSARWITSSPANGKVAAMPSQDIIRYPSHNAVAKETLLASDTSAGRGESSTAADQPSGSLLKDNSMHKPPSECSAGPGKAEQTMEASSSALTTASFPWEMFVEAAGPSRSARKEFVKVYNRARDELKNQKASSSATKVPDKEIQPKILEKLKKVNGSVSQPEGVISAHVPQEEQLSKRHHCASLLEGEVDTKSKQDSKAFQSIRVSSGKDSTSFVCGQHGGPLHGYVEPPAVAPKDCGLTLGKISEWKQSAAPERCYQAAATGREVFQPSFVDKAGRDIKDVQSEAPMLLSKRQRGISESPHAVVTGKECLLCERLPSRSDFWLQRWYPPHGSIKGVLEHKLLEADRTGHDLARCSTGNVFEVKKRDEHGACDKATDFKQRSTDKGILFQRIVEESEPKHFSEKVLPSAAAMAIVGTAARKFCTVQPQRKGSFAFWSGFGGPAPQTPDHHFIEKGKRKHSF